MTKRKEKAKAYSGLLGAEVIVKQGSKGKNVVRMATVEPKRTPSEKQEDNTHRLADAAKYARIAMGNPALREMYASRSANGKNAYREASNDFMRKPVIREIDAIGYRGNPGDKIGVVARDKIGIKAVDLALLAADGTLVESGSCVENPTT